MKFFLHWSSQVWSPVSQLNVLILAELFSNLGILDLLEKIIKDWYINQNANDYLLCQYLDWYLLQYYIGPLLYLILQNCCWNCTLLFLSMFIYMYNVSMNIILVCTRQVQTLNCFLNIVCSVTDTTDTMGKVTHQ